VQRGEHLDAGDLKCRPGASFDCCLQQSAAEISPDLIDGYLNTRYGDVLDRYPWKGLEVKAVLETTAAYQTGTVSVTQGSTAVEGRARCSRPG